MRGACTNQYGKPATRSGWMLLLMGGLLTGVLAGGDVDSLCAEEPVAKQAEQVWSPWRESRFQGTPDPPPPYRAEVAYPGLTFDRPLELVLGPDGRRLFVVEHRGKIYSFVDEPAAESADLFIDLKQTDPEINEVYALAFHPRFKENHYCYVCYIKKRGDPEGSVIARFTVNDTEPPTLDPDSEQIVLRWLGGGHNGCCLAFGPDGYLYISTGDGVGPAPPDANLAGQDVTNLLSAILRIDVDSVAAGRNYGIPADNPFVDLPQARPEIWAYGFRNPWRMSFDEKRGDLWVGDVGWQLWEMIYRVERGGNYGWSIMEGPQPTLPDQPRGPTPILPPIISHPHSEAASITGGRVYYGTELPELRGAYLYGDYQSGKLWGLRYDGHRITWQQELAHTPLTLVSFARDKQGELLLLDYQRSQQIYRLVKNPEQETNTQFPRRLSESGLFRSTPQQLPAEGVIPYAIRAQHWADHTESQRWLAIPGETSLAVDQQGNIDFPEGSVLAKTVSLALSPGEEPVRLETQILHREQGSWRPYAYRWNAEQTDAELIPAQGDRTVMKVADTTAPDGIREQAYRFASRAECQLCHNPWAEKRTTVYGFQSASPLAVNLAQLQGVPLKTGDEDSLNSREESESSSLPLQLETWQEWGLLTGPLPETSATPPGLVDPYDPREPLEARARAYLHVNCAQCHQPHAGGATIIELTHDASDEKLRLFNELPTQGNFGIEEARLVAPGDPTRSILLYRLAKRGGGRMPRLGTEELDVAGVALMREWIHAQAQPVADHGDQHKEGESPTVEPLAAHPVPTGILQELAAAREEQEQRLNDILTSPRLAFALFLEILADEPRPELKRRIVSAAMNQPRSEVRDLYEHFVPRAQRAQRLGEDVRPAEILALPGDPLRGRELFFQEGATACAKCHRVGETGGMIGPDLSQIGKKYRRDEMLIHLLEPSREIAPEYVTYTLETVSGRLHTGLLISRDAAALHLREATGKDIHLKTEEIEQLQPQQTSLMPEQLLRDLTPQQVADLLVFLDTLR